jgi:ethanolaminephosphotransferase
VTLWIVYAITAVKGGGSFWQQSMLRAFGIPKPNGLPDKIYEMPFNQWYIVYGGVVLVFNTIQRYFSPICSHTCIRWLNSTPSAMHVQKMRKSSAAHAKSAPSPLLGLLPAVVMWILVGSYLYLQPIILYQHLVPFLFYVGLINAYSVGRIITAHLTKDPNFPYDNILIAPLALAVIDSLGPRLGIWNSALGDGTYQIAFMFACLGLGIGVYGSFVVSIHRLWRRLLWR